MMFTMAVPSFVTDSQFSVQASHKPAALFVVSALALAANIAVAIYQVRKIRTQRLNPLKDELFTDLPGYKSVVSSIPGRTRTADSENASPVAV
jgi:hypothetical protein